MAKLGIKFDGFDEVISRLEKIGADTKVITEKALIESHKQVTAEAETVMQRHNQTGRTVRSLRKNAKVVWAGTQGSIDVGFDISNGGLPSIFLMYGTPRMRKNMRLWGAFYGARRQHLLAELQSEIFYSELSRL